MVDGFFWTRVTSKLLRFLYEDIVSEDLPAPMRERPQSVDVAPEAPALEPTPREGEHRARLRAGRSQQ